MVPYKVFLLLCALLILFAFTSQQEPPIDDMLCYKDKDKFVECILTKQSELRRINRITRKHVRNRRSCFEVAARTLPLAIHKREKRWLGMMGTLGSLLSRLFAFLSRAKNSLFKAIGNWNRYGVPRIPTQASALITRSGTVYTRTVGVVKYAPSTTRLSVLRSQLVKFTPRVDTMKLIAIGTVPTTIASAITTAITVSAMRADAARHAPKKMNFYTINNHTCLGDRYPFGNCQTHQELWDKNIGRACAYAFTKQNTPLIEECIISGVTESQEKEKEIPTESQIKKTPMTMLFNDLITNLETIKAKAGGICDETLSYQLNIQKLQSPDEGYGKRKGKMIVFANKLRFCMGNDYYENPNAAFTVESQCLLAILAKDNKTIDCAHFPMVKQFGFNTFSPADVLDVYRVFAYPNGTVARKELCVTCEDRSIYIHKDDEEYEKAEKKAIEDSRLDPLAYADSEAQYGKENVIVKRGPRPKRSPQVVLRPRQVPGPDYAVQGDAYKTPGGWSNGPNSGRNMAHSGSFYDSSGQRHSGRLDAATYSKMSKTQRFEWRQHQMKIMNNPYAPPSASQISNQGQNFNPGKVTGARPIVGSPGTIQLTKPYAAGNGYGRPGTGYNVRIPTYLGGRG